MRTAPRILIVSALLVGPSLFGVEAAPAQAGTDRAAAFERADTNGDGKVTREEFGAAREQEFRKMDRNGDGKLTKSDFPRLANSQRYGAKFDNLFRFADTNHDGAITHDEFRNNDARTFNLADANHDGVIDRAEIERLRAARPKA